MPISETRKEENRLYKQKCYLNFIEGYIGQPIYRIFPLNRLLDLFNSKMNTLIKPKMWDDPFENVLFKQKALLNTGEPVDFTKIHDSFYGQCWTINQNETDALWRIYSPNKDGIRVKTTIDRLFDSFYNIECESAYMKYFIGQIIYRSKEEIKEFFEESDTVNGILRDTSIKSAVSTLLIKRKEFSHENEVRLLYSTLFENVITSKDIFQYKIEPNELFDELLFDPRFDKNIYTCVKAELNRLGFYRSILQSDLYDPPNFNLTM